MRAEGESEIRWLEEVRGVEARIHSRRQSFGGVGCANRFAKFERFGRIGFHVNFVVIESEGFGAAPNACAAILASLSRNFSSARYIAEPPTAVPRLPNVPIP